MPVATTSYPAPLQSSGSLSKFQAFDLTPSVGTEFHESVKIKDLLSRDAPPTAIRDLAILVAERGVVFFRSQEDLTAEDQLELVDRMGRETGRPEESSLHVHPIQGETNELGGGGDKVFKITAEFNGALDRLKGVTSSRASNIWHSDISFENHPSDYAMLRMNTIPKVGGDTLWASAYEAYDRLSPVYQAFLSTLTATHVGDCFYSSGAKFREPRGHPENVGQHLSASHPLIRTNPVTGWKGLYVNKFFTKRINEISKDESDNLLNYLFEHITQNHDLQVRFRWQPGSIAIWDNRSTFHCATNDYGTAARNGDRVVSVGEKPYYDPRSLSRTAALESSD